MWGMDAMSPRPLVPRLPLAPCETQLLELAEAHNRTPADGDHRRESYTAGLPWALVSLTGCSLSTAYRLIRNGLTWEFADRLAVALGTHPALLWGQAWWDLCAEYERRGVAS